MAVTIQSTTPFERRSTFDVPCPECGARTDEGECLNARCHTGFYNVQVRLGAEVPESWYNSEGPEFPPAPAPSWEVHRAA